MNLKIKFIMKSKRILPLILLSVTLLISSNIKSQTFEWTRSFGGINNDFGNGMVVDDAGNVYTAGSFDATTDFDPGPGTFILSPNNNSDIFIHKMDAQGNFLWAKSFGSNTAESGYSMTADNSGHLYITGYFAGTMSINTISGPTSLTTAGSSEIFIMKLDEDGHVFWASSFGGIQGDSGYEIAVDDLGNVYTAGSFSATVDFDPGPDTTQVISNGNTDVFIHKMDAQGNFVWVKTFGGTGGDYAQSLTVDESGNVYTTGYFADTVNFNPGEDALHIFSAVFDDMFIHKLDSQGNFQWVKVAGGPSGNSGLSITLDDFGNIYTTGNFKESMDFDSITGNESLISAGDRDIFIQKMNADGQLLWVRSIGGSGRDIGWSVATDKSGHIYVTGTFTDTVDFDAGAGVALLTSAGKSDIFIQKMDSEGRLLWAQSFGGIDNDEAFAVKTDDSGHVYVVGTFQDTMVFEPAALVSAGFKDVFILKLSQIISDISETPEILPVLAYPNPTNGTVNISLEKPMDNVNMKIIDVNGKLINSTFFSQLLQEKIEIPGHSGIYFIHLLADNEQRVIKIMKE